MPISLSRSLRMSFEHMGYKKYLECEKTTSYTFINFDYHKDARDAIWDLDGKHNWKIELSYNSKGVGDRSDHDRGGGNFDLKCYKCDEPRHVARECRCELVLEDLTLTAVIAGVQASIHISLAQIGTRISCLKLFLSNTWVINSKTTDHMIRNQGIKFSFTLTSY